MKEMVRTNDAFYIIQIKDLLNNPHFFNTMEPVGMRLAIVLCQMAEVDRSFMPILRDFYAICMDNGISFIKNEERKIKDMLK
jgi:hypothetical protein